MDVQFLTMESIDNSVVNLLNRFGINFTAVNAPPAVPVDEICEQFLKLDIVPGDLSRDFPEKDFGDAIGALDIAERTVYLDSNENLPPNRYRFTVAHEIGHYELHRPLLQKNASQGDLFSPRIIETTIVCRRSNQYDRAEWQANQFAGALLMTKPRLVPFIMQFKKRYKIEDIIDPFLHQSNLNQLLGEISYHFKVSRQAALIRLENLTIVDKSHPQVA